MNLRKRALPSVTQTGMNLRIRALPSETQTGMNLKKKNRQDGGTLCVNAPPGCEFECMKHAPEPNKHSLKLKVKVCVKMWNCVPGNTINTVCALGHQELFTSNQKFRLNIDKSHYANSANDYVHFTGSCACPDTSSWIHHCHDKKDDTVQFNGIK